MQTSSAHQVLHRTFSYCTALLRASVRKFCCKECTWSLLRNFFATRLSAFGQKLLWYLPGYGTFVTLLQHKLLLYRACSKIRIQTRYSSKQNANWCLLFVLIRHGFRGGPGPQRWIRALGEETGNPIMAFHRRSFFPSVERAPHHTTTENSLLGGDPLP